LTIYPASKPNGQAIIACPGGGYAGIATTHEGHDMAAWFNTQGITYAVLHYRMPYGNHEIPLSDAHQAIRYMRKHADQWNIRQLGIMGSSAGGHLASTAATHFDAETRPDFQILFYPVITMGEYTHQGSKNLLLGKNPSEELVKLYSNELQVNEQTPPAFIMHSSDDKAVPVQNSINYCLAMCKYNVPVSMHFYPVGGHGWGYNESFPYKPQWKNEMEKWLKELL
jgi:acetyl esterase/lipase